MTNITIILPVYDAYEAVRACLASLVRTLDPRQSLLMIDDASTDARVRPLLESYASVHIGAEILTNDQNRGFVQSVNSGLDATREDVVLLNSDTVTTPGWLERLQRCAASDTRIATVTPFSNNAEICSFPEFCKPNPMPTDPDAIASALRKAGAPTYPDIPTAVGFCMYIRRQALDALGSFDADTFGRGYGEENDFCMRASAAGWRHVLCDDAYVAHIGRQSFAATGLAPGGPNLERLVTRWPRYTELIADFIRRDPLRACRLRILQYVDPTCLGTPKPR